MRWSATLAKFLLLVVDTGLVVYWVAVVLDLIPVEQAFRDYTNPMMQAWNWSFFPLDLLAVFFGYLGIYMTGRDAFLGKVILIVGLTLTFCAGFMAISFWAYYGDYNALWWISNGLLMVIPMIVFAILFICEGEFREQSH